MVQVFESTAGALPPHQFRKFAWPVLRDIAIQVKHRCKTEQIPCVPMIVFAKDAHHALADLIASDYDVIGIDWTMDIKQVQRVALQQLQSGVRSRITFQGILGTCFTLGFSFHLLARPIFLFISHLLL
jgi:uroporphyrinogen-III decarboxylase